MSEKKPLLKIEHLEKQYDTSQRIILNDLNLDVYAEDFLCVLGPSGCGKSTLIRCIAGFEEYKGSITVDEMQAKKPAPDRVMVFQDFNQLFPWKTVLGNVTYPLKVNKIAKDKEELNKLGEIYLEKVNLIQYKDYYPHQLSGGMKQRVAIARGLALGSKIMLMDEPFAALDAMTRNQMQNELLSIKEKEKLTIILITHNIQEAICLGSRIIVMSKDGHIKEHRDNDLPKPTSPATPGYGELWNHLNRLLVEEREKEEVKEEAVHDR